ncbi:MAG TPA: tetratricopeptide repeat protein [Rhizomicrobium sp.]|nr:tetratricopeptide repeat protein [Rhizomicrobium sp.]
MTLESLVSAICPRNFRWATAIKARNYGFIIDWFIRWFFRAGILALAIAAAAATISCSAKQGQLTCSVFDWSRGLRVLSLSMLLAGASWVLGWAFRLLFGVPRSLTQAPNGTTISSSGAGAATSASEGTETHRPLSRVNTNLEDISDWLTKTLVGVGLTQLTALPGFLRNLSRDIDANGFDWHPYGPLLALGLILYFLPGGFWLGYVGTRTFLTKLFRDFDPALPPDALKLAASPDSFIVTDSGYAPTSAPVAQIDQTLRDLPLQALQSVTEVVAWAAAQARNRNFDAARVALQDVMRNDPGNSNVRQLLGNVDLASGQYAEAAQHLQGTPDTPAKVLAALYATQPDSFTKAIAIGEPLAKDAKYREDPNLHVWLACAYAQKYGYSVTHDGTPSELLALKQQMLTEIKSAIALDSSMRNNLHAFWKPVGGSIDDDLSVFPPDDPDLTALLEPAGATPGPAASTNPDRPG